MGKKKRVRPLAICVFRHHDRILVMEGYDPVKKEHFYRPLGGGIEFGEPGHVKLFAASSWKRSMLKWTGKA